MPPGGVPGSITRAGGGGLAAEPVGEGLGEGLGTMPPLGGGLGATPPGEGLGRVLGDGLGVALLGEELGTVPALGEGLGVMPLLGEGLGSVVPPLGKRRGDGELALGAGLACGTLACCACGRSGSGGGS